MLECPGGMGGGGVGGSNEFRGLHKLNCCRGTHTNCEAVRAPPARVILLVLVTSCAASTFWLLSATLPQRQVTGNWWQNA